MMSNNYTISAVYNMHFNNDYFKKDHRYSYKYTDNDNYLVIGENKHGQLFSAQEFFTLFYM